MTEWVDYGFLCTQKGFKMHMVQAPLIVQNGKWLVSVLVPLFLLAKGFQIFTQCFKNHKYTNQEQISSLLLLCPLTLSSIFCRSRRMIAP